MNGFFLMGCNELRNVAESWFIVNVSRGAVWNSYFWKLRAQLYIAGSLIISMELQCTRKPASKSFASKSCN